jgi:DNA-binding transcriptional MerR regulator
VTPKLYKASEVCEATGLQPYVLRSWEKEFPGIGVQKSGDSPRLYRQADLDQVLRIKQLVFVEGLTLAGARRRLGEELLPRTESARVRAEKDVLNTLGADARSRIELVRTGLRSILHVLSNRAGTTLPELPANGSRRETMLRAVKPANGGRATRSSANVGRSRPSASAKPAKRAAATKRSGPVRKAKTGKRKRTSA